MAVEAKVASVSEFLGLRTDTPPSNCPQNYSSDCSDLVFYPRGMDTRNPFRRDITFPAEIVYRKEFLAKNGTKQILALSVTGALYVVHQDGTFTQIDSVTPGSKVNSITAYGREYMSFFNDGGGCDAPRQWDGNKLYRVSQGGPGASAIFSAAAIVGDTYPIASITQPAAHSQGFSYFLQSTGPGSTAAGTTATVYYQDSTIAGPDMDLVNAFNSGFPVYVRASFTGVPVPQGPYTVLVTSIGDAQPPGQPRSFYYFTYELPTSAATFYAGSGHAGYTANYQRTLATLTTTVPVPSLEVDNVASISGTSVTDYDGNITVTQTPTSGDLQITQSSLTGGTALYHYSVLTGVPPTAGQLVTIIGTLNANGSLNGSNLTITSASGGSSGTFTVAGFTAPDFPTVVENGDGQTAGTVFAFDPGAAAVGSVVNPIHGNSTGGTLTFGGSSATIASGTRLGVVFFITDTDLTTAPSPIYKFTIPANTNAIAYTGLPIGPPNVKARGMAFTGANGGNFFFLPIVPQVNGTVLGTSTVVNDNTTTSGIVQFTDLALFGGIAIDIPGNNLFEQVALNLPRGVNWYADRMLWIGEKNTVTGFQNMGMDGGTLSGSTSPLGWFGGSGVIQQVGIMPAYVVTGPGMGQISQSAYQTAAGVNIILPKLKYSLRFWMQGSGSKTGQLQAVIYSTTGFSSHAIFNLSDLTTDGYYTVDFDNAMPDSIPGDLALSIAFTGLPAGQTATTRDYQMIYADNPNRNPLARFSYVQNPEAYDSLTGNSGPNDDSTELRATAVLQENLYFITEKGQYSIQQIGNTEPSSWDPQQISDKCGAFNSNSTVTGKGWIAWAGPEGTFWFGGGLPEKISAIIAPTWRQVASVTNVFNDSNAERVYFGTIDGEGNKKPMVYDYHEIALGGAGKWCPWNRPVGWISSSATRPVFTIGAKFFHLDTVKGIADDDLGPIGGYYLFAPIASSMTRKIFSYMGLEISGTGILTPFVYTKTPQNLTQTLSAQDLAALVDIVAEWRESLMGRLLYLKIGQPGVQFSLQNFATVYQPDPNQPITGVR